MPLIVFCYSTTRKFSTKIILHIAQLVSTPCVHIGKASYMYAVVEHTKQESCPDESTNNSSKDAQVRSV